MGSEPAALSYIGLGSNLGDRAGHLAHALRRLEELGRITGVSDVRETAPVGFMDQPPFLNLVVRLETELEPGALLAATAAIEEERGRARSFRNAPRTLDIDLLLYGEREVDGGDVTVPHPRMRRRAFVLVPLLELDPELREPGTGRPYAAYLTELVTELEDADEGVSPHRDPARPVGGQRIMKGRELLDA